MNIYISFEYEIPKDLDKKYDYFIVGSDQIWSPNFVDYKNEFLTLFALRISPYEKHTIIASKDKASASIIISNIVIKKWYHTHFNDAMNIENGRIHYSQLKSHKKNRFL